MWQSFSDNKEMIKSEPSKQENVTPIIVHIFFFFWPLPTKPSPTCRLHVFLALQPNGDAYQIVFYLFIFLDLKDKTKKERCLKVYFIWEDIPCSCTKYHQY